MKSFLFALTIFLLAACDNQPAAPKVTPTDLSKPEAIGSLGLIHDESLFQQPGEYWVSTKKVAVPAKWDLRDKAKVFPVPGDQGDCGSCWAYSSAQGLIIYIAANKGILIDLSKQTVLSCSDIDAQNWGCGGGTMGAVAFLKRGLPPESEFPYRASKVSCKYDKAQLNAGFGNGVIETPWVGESLSHSRYWKASGKTYMAGDKIAQIQQAMVELNSPAIVTVAAYGANSDAVVTKCGSINSGGNHMVNVIGWDDEGGGPNAHTFNSWGPGHGKAGISRIKWSCGADKLNQGLGVEARVLRGEMKPPCDPPENPNLKGEQILFAGNKVEIGRAIANVKCVWSPVEGLKDPNSCVTDASPSKSTEYHLQVSNECGSVSAMQYLRVFAPVFTGSEETFKESSKINTPFGEISRQ